MCINQKTVPPFRSTHSASTLTSLRSSLFGLFVFVFFKPTTRSLETTLFKACLFIRGITVLAPLMFKSCTPTQFYFTLSL